MCKFESSQRALAYVHPSPVINALPNRSQAAGLKSGGVELYVASLFIIAMVNSSGSSQICEQSMDYIQSVLSAGRAITPLGPFCYHNRILWCGPICAIPREKYPARGCRSPRNVRRFPHGLQMT